MHTLTLWPNKPEVGKYLCATPHTVLRGHWNNKVWANCQKWMYSLSFKIFITATFILSHPPVLFIIIMSDFPCLAQWETQAYAEATVTDDSQAVSELLLSLSTNKGETEEPTEPRFLPQLLVMRRGSRGAAWRSHSSALSGRGGSSSSSESLWALPSSSLKKHSFPQYTFDN